MGGSGRGDSGDRPAAHDVNGGELLEDDAGLGPHVHRVELHDVAGEACFVTLGLACGVLALPLAAADREAPEGFDELPGALEIAQDAAHARGAEMEALALEQDNELELAPGGVQLT